MKLLVPAVPLLLIASLDWTGKTDHAAPALILTSAFLAETLPYLLLLVSLLLLRRQRN